MSEIKNVYSDIRGKNYFVFEDNTLYSIEVPYNENLEKQYEKISLIAKKIFEAKEEVAKKAMEKEKIEAEEKKVEKKD